MITHQLALIRREIWEHRSLYVTPAVVGFVMSLMLLTGFVFASNYAEIIDIGVFSAQNLAGDVERRAAVFAFLLANTAPFLFASAILTIFYCLDSLYAERKNKSILFWRSMPVTDAETVISKLLTALVAIPVITLVVLMAANVINLILTGIFVDIEGGSPGYMIWRPAPAALLDVGVSMLLLMLMLPIWFSPFIGWFLFVSAFTKRSPLLVAAMPIVLLPMFERLFFDTSIMAEALFVRSIKFPLFSGVDNMDLIFQESDDLARLAEAELSVFGLLDLGNFLASPQLWLGLVVCGLFTAAAIYVRRYRDES